LKFCKNHSGLYFGGSKNETAGFGGSNPFLLEIYQKFF
jgi:hypothetical protein